jgi:sulfite reductase (NADPH) flavoprotein alpha-component
MKAAEFPGRGLTVDQWTHIEALAVSLSPQQMMWVSGYFAGFDAAGRRDKALLELEAPRAEVAPQAAQAARAITVLYGSETGNGAELARSLEADLAALGWAATLADMGDYKLRRLREEQDLLIVTSTHGEGDPPQSAADFFEFLESRKAPALPHLRFSVLALGDSTYEHYCEAGRRLDRRLEELGALRLHPRADCDVDYEEPAAAWIAAVLSSYAPDRYAGAAGTAAAVSAQPRASAGIRPTAAVAFDKRRPFPAPVIDNLVLTGRGSSKETRHIEISLEGSGLSFEPGDALGVVPQNDAVLAAELMAALDLAGASEVSVRSGAASLAEALSRDFEITAATPRFFDHWAGLSGASELKALASADRAAERTAFLRTHHIIDLVRAYPVKGLDAQLFLAGLRPLQPRLYSIASSLSASGDEAHLTVSTVRYDLKGLSRTGVASGHLAERAAVDSIVPVYVQPNPHFRLPEDPDVPILMIGAGTGVAPYRAFLQEREALGGSGRNWLVFGERNFRTDFLYQTEWQGYLRDGLLTRMDVAFSRDTGGKVYVQDRLREQAADVFAWLEEGAHVYVCGDAERLAPDVHRALAEILQQHGGMGPEAAEDHLRGLQRDRRYQRDVY